MAPAPPASLLEKADAFRVLGQTMLVALTHLFTTPIRSGPRPDKLFKDVLFKALRFQLANLNLSQENYLNPTTETNYLAHAKSAGFKPDALSLPSGCKAYWLGNKKADKIIIFLHGGGYVRPCSLGHVHWISDLVDDLAKAFSIGGIILSYTCSPEAQYPTQISQAAELLHHLLTVEGHKPSDIIIAGDSAGGNLALGLFSHILHPHASVPTKIELSEPLRAGVLISPWVDFNVNQASFDRNVQTDYLPREIGTRWGGAFMGNAKPDNYNQPILADSEWFSKLDSVVGDILIWGGGGEVLIDSIDGIAQQLKEVFPKTKYIVQPGASHEDMILEKFVGYKEKAQGTELIENWIASKL